MGGKPKVPKAPPPVVPTPDPTPVTNPAVAEAAQQNLADANIARQRKTILSSSQGVSTTGNTAKKTLLGN